MILNYKPMFIVQNDGNSDVFHKLDEIGNIGLNDFPKLPRMGFGPTNPWVINSTFYLLS